MAKKLLHILIIMITFIILVGCTDDNAEFSNMSISPAIVVAGDTLYWSGLIETTSPITENDISVTFTDTAEINQSSYFELIALDSLDDEYIIVGKNNYRIAAITSVTTPTNDYIGKLAVTVGGVTKVDEIPFSVDSTTVQLVLSSMGLSHDTATTTDTVYWEGSITSSKEFTNNDMVLTFLDSADNVTQALVPLNKSYIQSTDVDLGKSYYQAPFEVGSSPYEGLYKAVFTLTVDNKSVSDTQSIQVQVN